MNKNRMQKLAGINEGTAFKNGKFELDRYDAQYGGGEIDPLGNWCLDKDVEKLEEIANQMYAVLSTFDTPAVKSLLKKAKSL